MTIKHQMWSLLIENGRKGSEIWQSYLLRRAEPTPAEKPASHEDLHLKAVLRVLSASC